MTRIETSHSDAGLHAAAIARWDDEGRSHVRSKVLFAAIAGVLISIIG